MKTNQRLVRLGDTGEIVADVADDLTGRSMKDKDGSTLGTVDDLLVDPDDHAVRFLIVTSGGFLGLGKDKSFIPVDAVTHVSEDEVYIDQALERVAGAPVYDPDIVEGPDFYAYYGSLYTYYGVAPYWAPGYVYPSYAAR